MDFASEFEKCLILKLISLKRSFKSLTVSNKPNSRSISIIVLNTRDAVLESVPFSVFQWCQENWVVEENS